MKADQSNVLVAQKADLEKSYVHPWPLLMHMIIGQYLYVCWWNYYFLKCCNMSLVWGQKSLDGCVCVWGGGQIPNAQLYACLTFCPTVSQRNVYTWIQLMICEAAWENPSDVTVVDFCNNRPKIGQILFWMIFSIFHQTDMEIFLFSFYVLPYQRSHRDCKEPVYKHCTDTCSIQFIIRHQLSKCRRCSCTTNGMKSLNAISPFSLTMKTRL